MTQFSFTTNIEKRMPDTGNVFCIDRMTSDYAEQHPLDVDGFIESVYQEFAGTEFEESRETLRSIWTAVLSVTSPRGDASVYPNKDGRKRAAAMKVWLRAGDYWRRGFRQGDTLPDMVPMTKITRLNDGAWIALFPKDAHLLEEGHTDSTEISDKERITNANTPCDGIKNPDEQIAEPVEQTDNNIEPVRNQSEPRQLDLFAFEQLQQENQTLHARIVEMERLERDRAERQRHLRQQENHCQQRRERQRNEVPEWKRKLDKQWRKNHPGMTAEEYYRNGGQMLTATASDGHEWLKLAGYAAAASVALLVIWQTGLIIPLGLIGLATSGFLK